MDANGCTSTCTATVTEPPLLTCSAVVDNDVSCNGFSDGQITATGAGGTPGYTYSLNGGAFQASGTFSGLAAGTHTVTVMDANGCTSTCTATVTEPPLLTCSAVVDNNVSCNGFSDGQITATGAGGTPGYTYSLNGGAFQASGTFSGLAAGTHTVTVMDANGCTSTCTATVTEPPLLTCSAVVDNNVSCNGFSDGQITATGAGGTPGYTYSLNGGAFQASGTFSGLAAGYTYRHRDGCQWFVLLPVLLQSLNHHYSLVLQS